MNRLTIIVAIIVVFLLAMIITWLLPAFPALSFAATLLVFIFGNLNDEEKTVVFGFFIGLLLDMLTQEVPGVNALALSFIGAAVSLLRKYFSFDGFLWYFLVGILAFFSRTLIILVAHALIDGTLIVTTDLRSFLSAALWTGILGAFYLQLVRRA